MGCFLSKSVPRAATRSKSAMTGWTVKTDRGQFAGQTVVGRGVAPEGDLPRKIVQRLFRSSARRETTADLGERGIGLGRDPALHRAGAARERKGAGQPTILNMLDNRRGFGEREIAVDQDRRAAARLIALNSGLFKSPASNDRILR